MPPSPTSPISGHTIRAAEIYNDHVFIFALESIPPDTGPGSKSPPKPMIACYDGSTGEWHSVSLPHKGTRYVSTTGAMAPRGNASVFFTKSPPAEGLAAQLYDCSFDGQLNVTPSDVVARDMIATPNDAKHFDDTLFACGNEQTLVRRNGPNAYDQLHFKDGGRRVLKHENWTALDGYGPDDIYLAGNHRCDPSLMHFDGTTFRPCPMPAGLDDFDGRAIVCADDGIVYALSSDATLLRGNVQTGFDMVATTFGTNHRDMASPNIDGPRALAWFQGRLYLSLNWLYVLDGTTWTPVLSDNGHQPLYFKSLTTNGNVLLQYNGFSASYFDGTTWHDIQSHSRTITDMIDEGRLARHLKWVRGGQDIQTRLEAKHSAHRSRA